jgi:hypothetical protein
MEPGSNKGFKEQAGIGTWPSYTCSFKNLSAQQVQKQNRETAADDFLVFHGNCVTVL